MRCSSLRFRIFSRLVCFASCATVFCRDFDPSFCLATLRCILRRPLLSTRLRSTVAAVRESPAHSSAAGVDADGVLHILDRELCFEMVEHEVEIHSVRPAADENLKRLDTWWYTFVPKTQDFGRSLDIARNPYPCSHQRTHIWHYRNTSRKSSSAWKI